VEKSARKSVQNLHRIHENGAQSCKLRAQNFQFFLAQNSDNPTYNILAPYLWSCSISWLQADYRNGDQCRPVGLCILVNTTFSLT